MDRYLIPKVKSEQDNYLIGNPNLPFLRQFIETYDFSIDYQFNNFIGDTYAFVENCMIFLKMVIYYIECI